MQKLGSWHWNETKDEHKVHVVFDLICFTIGRKLGLGKQVVLCDAMQSVFQCVYWSPPAAPSRWYAFGLLDLQPFSFLRARSSRQRIGSCKAQALQYIPSVLKLPYNPTRTLHKKAEHVVTKPTFVACWSTWGIPKEHENQPNWCPTLFQLPHATILLGFPWFWIVVNLQGISQYWSNNGMGINEPTSSAFLDKLEPRLVDQRLCPVVLSHFCKGEALGSQRRNISPISTWTRSLWDAKTQSQPYRISMFTWVD